MPIATLQFSAPLNVSCQVGDTAYYVNTQAGDVEFTVNNGSVVEIGTIVQIEDREVTPTVQVYTTLTGWENELSNEQFILFSKDNKANLSSPLGYFAEVKMSTNAVTTPSELHAVSMDMFTSSK
tara:strand:- start:271 stop:642 length:372 start_codon:yes stop_codon:yes gene_type:complete